MSAPLLGKQIGNYKVTRLLGEGGMGAVYLGEHPLIGKKVAIKVLHEDLAQKEDIVKRFFTEAKAVNDIGHENIVDIVDFGKMKDDDGKDLVYFIMEFLEGESLNDRIKRGGLGQADAVRIIMQCASALAASHKKNIVHRDLKPDNIYLLKRGHDDLFVKLLDFGIAKLTSDGADTAKTRAGSVLGTPAYMSPEQCDGKGNIDWRADVYALGVVLFELCTGRVPFTGDGFGEILVAQLTKAPPAPSSLVASIEPGLEQIILRCLEKSREERFQSMDEMREALENSGAYVPPQRTQTGLRPVTGQGTAPSTGARTGTTGNATRNPTTLSGAAGEAQNSSAATPRAGGSKMPLYAGLAVLLLGGGGGAAWFATHGGEGAKLPPAVVKPVAPPAPELVTIKITSEPAGATVRRAGVSESIGTTPFEIKLKKGEPDFDVALNLAGYKPETKTITTNHSREVLALLQQQEPAPVVAPPPPVTPAAAHPTRPTGTRPGRPGGHHNSSDPDGVLAPQL